MYSPKIDERYIPVLYRLAKARGMPMTRLVAEAIDAYLAAEEIDAGAEHLSSIRPDDGHRRAAA